MDGATRNLIERTLELIRPADLAPYPDNYPGSVEERDFNEWLNGAESAVDLDFINADWQATEWKFQDRSKSRVAILAYLIHAVIDVDHDCFPLCEGSEFLTCDELRQEVFDPNDYPVILELLRAIHAQQPENDYRDVYLAAHIALFEKLVQAPQTK